VPRIKALILDLRRKGDVKGADFWTVVLQKSGAAPRALPQRAAVRALPAAAKPALLPPAPVANLVDRMAVAAASAPRGRRRLDSPAWARAVAQQVDPSGTFAGAHLAELPRKKRAPKKATKKTTAAKTPKVSRAAQRKRAAAKRPARRKAPKAAKVSRAAPRKRAAAQRPAGVPTAIQVTGTLRIGAKRRRKASAKRAPKGTVKRGKKGL